MLEYLLPVVTIMSVYSAPATLVFVTFSLSVLGYPLRQHFTRIVMFSLLESLLVTALMPLFTATGHMIYSAIVFFALFLFMFRSWPWLHKLGVSVLAYLLILLSRSVWFIIGPRYADADLLTTSVSKLILFYWPIFAFFTLLTILLVRTKPVDETAGLMKRLSGSRKTLMACLILFFVIQVVLTMIYFSIQYESILSRESVLMHTLYISGLLCGLFLLLFSAQLIRLSRESAARSTHEFYIQDINNMYNAIRGQRHDFLNHVQVIASMLANRKYEDAERYIADLAKETQQIRDWIDIGHPGFSALIQAKLALAVSLDIRLDFEFSGLENVPVNIKSIDVVRISGNLLDNAIEAVASLPKEQRWVEITGIAAEDHLYITVRNPGPVLGEEELRRCFSPGYTTKRNGKNSGLGLLIVRMKVEEYKGTLQARSNEEEGTVFTVRIPF